MRSSATGTKEAQRNNSRRGNLTNNGPSMLAWLQDGSLVGIRTHNLELLGPRSPGEAGAAAPTPTPLPVQGIPQGQPGCPQAGWDATMAPVHGGTRLTATALSSSTHRNGRPAVRASIPRGVEG